MNNSVTEYQYQQRLAWLKDNGWKKEKKYGFKKEYYHHSGRCGYLLVSEIQVRSAIDFTSLIQIQEDQMMKKLEKEGMERKVTSSPDTDRIFVCEECQQVFSHEEILADACKGEWGHKCKMKKYKEEHRCESYLRPYLPEV